MIRLATTQDIPSIQDIAKTTWAVTYNNILSEEQMSYMLDLFYSDTVLAEKITHIKETSFFMFEIEYESLGFIQLVKSKTILRLEKIYILPNTQGKGIGKQLIDFAKNQTKKLGLSKLQLNVNRYNSAVQFYEKQGFSITKEEDNAIGNGYFMNDYVMEWTVE